jgi:hypothetical protein
MTKEEWSALVRQPGWTKFVRYLIDFRRQLMVILAASPTEAGMDRVRMKRDVLAEIADLELDDIRQFYNLDVEEQQDPADAEGDTTWANPAPGM